MIISKEPNVAAWLLTWNPKKYNVGGIGTEEYSLGFNVGDVEAWRCLNSGVKIGDIAYLLRVGAGIEPKGIVARGVITSEYYDKSDAESDGEMRRVVDFKIEEIRETCEQGLLSSYLLKLCFPEQEWSPQASGIAIKPLVLVKLNEMWEVGESKHSLTQLLTWHSKNDGNLAWRKAYEKIITQSRAVRENKDLVDDEFISNLWKRRDNGISSLKQGVLSYKEYEENIDFLRDITYKIIESPDSKDAIDTIVSSWQKKVGEGAFRYVSYALINRTYAAISPERYTCVIKIDDCKKLISFLSKSFSLDIVAGKDWFTMNHQLAEIINQYAEDEDGYRHANRYLWRIYADKFSASSDAGCDEGNEEKCENILSDELFMNNQSLNKIFYGPPGTGKTFNTVDAALKVIDPGFYDENRERRALLNSRFGELSGEGRISFITFHQSFSYEDFVEGIKATTGSGGISYSVESGVFKSACVRANINISEKLDAFEQAITSLVDKCEQSATRLKLSTVRGKAFSIEYSGGDTFKVFPESTENENPNYVASITNVKKLYMTGSKQGLYNQSYVEGLLIFLKAELGLPEYSDSANNKIQSKPSVLIIDEINRGNISSIFGELITLIEPSKRAGAEEALTVTLPYSKEPFQVPKNLYIIGTMNTADRSLALMDTALRRRFDFVEMMPQVGLLQGLIINEIDIAKMLLKMNRRIEVLYDREHALGHAFFMPLLKLQDQPSAFDELQNIFANKILPLLEEYFFEDWEKIRLVLGDNQKTDHDQFISIKKEGYNATELFGSNTELDYEIENTVAYGRNEQALTRASAYIGIYES